ncbi:MAG: serine hydrolase [SAR86 cluster bacterium]|uniref:Serine hydrolase n=1 Tax=SAR86 cluster bacterium TaxID=2030880 RepID=A0A2A5C971_9GAMM|nr:serine hydrolase [bacterium AH-315-I11]MBN4075582.1 serine hydrolase [Gammaproteobacteria bacterium AH-315-E17]PCJ40362.1 MAG: serine hydrolase [SAR86 cluster bacterium]
MVHEKAGELEKLIQDQYKNIVGIIILKKSQIAYEHYFDGHNQNSPIHVASVTKSVLSALIGIAIEKGLINSVEQNVLDFFPEYKIKRGEKKIQEVTIRNLLTMTAPYKYKYEPYTRVYSSDDWTKSVLDLLGGNRDIGEFKYTTIGLHVLSGIITQATSQSALEFAKENLFRPLGIEVSQDIRIHNKDDYFALLKDKSVSGWVIDPKGVSTAGWGLTLTTMDMMKIGLLYLNKGHWKNNKIVPSKWIEDSIKTHSLWGDKAYGYLWWVIDDKAGTYAAIGDSGNVIYVSTEKKMVVAITSRFMPRAKDRIEFIREHIEPLF